ncbi:hypothetical protein E2C01_033418 [Portunus trituberculatus]|uniref:Uncharacterized protein n=1 Tax=Portunus trituberculatus TaxID=210409 RepID=A0A5B7F408_PORTR|nr:hypothetical protein [Portunus trituberculatus]
MFESSGGVEQNFRIRPLGRQHIKRTHKGQRNNCECGQGVLLLFQYRKPGPGSRRPTRSKNSTASGPGVVSLLEVLSSDEGKQHPPQGSSTITTTAVTSL